MKTVKEIYPEENDLRRKEFWYDLGHVSYTVEGEEVTSPYALIHKWRDYHYQTNSEMSVSYTHLTLPTNSLV